ncbi:hypothetical protein H7K45_28400 [Mycobacterium yunnanensis]|uniref:Lipoprotein LppI n=1 Tax=Mycobacterium yunnanensis TaxID=368477 RepID=A0A9X2Z979_9MYCO|nr:hypothetical protein [Mycobacterium yunnanensis]
MRIVLLIGMSALVAGCSGGAGGPVASTQGVPSGSPQTSTQTSTRTTAAPTSRPSPVAAAPRQGASIADVSAWIEAGTPVDVAGYRTMTRDGQSTTLGDGVAFTTAGAETNCVTNRYQDGALACLVKLADPPPRPPGIETAWKANWVDFTGTTVDVGSPHGDPGPFVDGTGAELAAGRSLAFGDYRCRADAAGLFCVDYAHQTAIALSARGVEPFGCLRKTAPPADIGLRFTC